MAVNIPISRWTRFFQAHYLPTKFGYDKRKAHLASLVVAGEITRTQALKELEKALYTENELAEDKAYVAKKLGLAVEELENFIDQPGRHYSEFPNNQERSMQFYRLYSRLHVLKHRLAARF